MATTTAYRRAALLAAAALVLGSAAPHAHRADWTTKLDADELELVGFAGHVPDSAKPKVTAYFPEQSYAAGSTAELRIIDRASDVRIQVLRAGMSAARISANDVMTGKPVTGVRRHRRGGRQPDCRCPPRRALAERLVLRPSHRSRRTHRLCDVRPAAAPTRHAAPSRSCCPRRHGRRTTSATGTATAFPTRGTRRATPRRSSRPFLNRGVPPHYKYYDHRFLAWVNLTGRKADFLSDADLNGTSGAALRKAYRVLVFEGHHEYVTEHEYDTVTRFRDLGGNLMFLSANNFFWKITIHDHVMTRVAKWRDLGRPEAALIGVEYFHNDMGEHRGPWVVRPAAAELRWLIDGTGLTPGMSFSSGGIEADDVTSDSPQERPRDRGDPESLRRRAQRRHDVLRVRLGREGVRRWSVHDRGGRLAAARTAADGQPVDGLLGGGARVGSPS